MYTVKSHFIVVRLNSESHRIKLIVRMFQQGNFQTVLYSLQQIIHVDKTTCLSSSKFRRRQQESVMDLVHYLLIEDIQRILPWFSLFLRHIKWMPP